MKHAHLPKPATLLPMDTVAHLRDAVAHRFDSRGRWIDVRIADQRPGVEQIDKIVARLRRKHPELFA